MVLLLSSCSPSLGSKVDKSNFETELITMAEKGKISTEVRDKIVKYIKTNKNKVNNRTTYRDVLKQVAQDEKVAEEEAQKRKLAEAEKKKKQLAQFNKLIKLANEQYSNKNFKDAYQNYRKASKLKKLPKEAQKQVTELAYGEGVKLQSAGKLDDAHEQFKLASEYDQNYKDVSKRIDSILKIKEKREKDEELRLRGLKWNYRTNKDKMGRGDKKFAYVESLNTVSFDFPYEGAQRAMLTLRRTPTVEMKYFLV